MNTSKQVNVMIGVMFLVALIFALNVLNEPNRLEDAANVQTEIFVERGAEIYVQNCRSCHGLEGLGPDEGAIAPALNSPAFLILGEDHVSGAEPTAAGVANGIRDFLGNTIACGRSNSVMPVWSDQYGGPLSTQQIDYLVTLITEGRWDLVDEIGHEVDSHQDPPATREDILSDGQGLSLTTENCGQYNALTAKPFRERDPFASASAGTSKTESEEGQKAVEAATDRDTQEVLVQGLSVSDYYGSLCAACHGANREGGLGLPLTREYLIEPDDFYIDTIKNGRSGTLMAAYGGGAVLTDEEVQAIVTWLKNTDP